MSNCGEMRDGAMVAVIGNIFRGEEAEIWLVRWLLGCLCTDITLRRGFSRVVPGLGGFGRSILCA